MMDDEVRTRRELKRVVRNLRHMIATGYPNWPEDSPHYRGSLEDHLLKAEAELQAFLKAREKIEQENSHPGAV
jgi:hypothetical protein